jgi:hypothetical protein
MTDDRTPLDGFEVESDDGAVILTLTATFGDDARYWIAPSDAAMIAAALLLHAVKAKTT